MSKRNPYEVVKSRYITEKAKVLEQLQFNKSNPSVKKCDSPKYVFLVDKRSNKQEIANGVEEVYSKKKVRVAKVNTINMKQKAKSVRGRIGYKAGFKKAVVTLQPGDTLEEKV